MANHEWAKGWLAGQVNLANEIAAQPDAWIEAMIPKEAPAHAYGFTCPHCVGKESQEATGYGLIRWSPTPSPTSFPAANVGPSSPTRPIRRH